MVRTHPQWLRVRESIRSGQIGELRAVSMLFSYFNRDPEFQMDRLTSAILEYPSGQSVFLCSTQLLRYQWFHLLGTKGRIDVEVPVNAPLDSARRISINDCVEEIAACNHHPG